MVWITCELFVMIGAISVRKRRRFERRSCNRQRLRGLVLWNLHRLRRRRRRASSATPPGPGSGRNTTLMTSFARSSASAGASVNIARMADSMMACSAIDVPRPPTNRFSRFRSNVEFAARRIRDWTPANHTLTLPGLQVISPFDEPNFLNGPSGAVNRPVNICDLLPWPAPGGTEQILLDC
jgi:hypothetical protein